MDVLWSYVVQITVSNMVKLYGLGEALGVAGSYRLQDNRQGSNRAGRIKPTKDSVTPSDIEPSIFRLVGHHLIQLRYRVSRFQ